MQNLYIIYFIDGRQCIRSNAFKLNGKSTLANLEPLVSLNIMCLSGETESSAKLFVSLGVPNVSKVLSILPLCWGGSGGLAALRGQHNARSHGGQWLDLIGKVLPTH